MLVLRPAGPAPGGGERGQPQAPGEGPRGLAGDLAAAEVQQEVGRLLGQGGAHWARVILSYCLL